MRITSFDLPKLRSFDICQLFSFVFQFWVWIFSTGFALEKKLKKDKESNFRTNTHSFICFFLLNYFIMNSQIFFYKKGTLFLTSTKFSLKMEHLLNFRPTGYFLGQISAQKTGLLFYQLG